MAKWRVEEERQRIDIDELKSRCDLRQIIVPNLEKVRQINGGDYFVGCCPFHDDKNPSFLVYSDYYRCLSPKCGEWGSIIDWYAHLSPSLEWWDLLQLISDECGKPASIPAKRRRVKIEVPQNEPLPEPLPPNTMSKYPMQDWVLDWIHEKWFLSRQMVERERIGYSERDRAIAIPIWGFNDELITVRFRNVDNPKMGKYWGISGRNEVYGYGRQWVANAAEAIIVFGEMTACFLHHEWGFATFSWTNGCKSFRPYLKPLLSHLKGGVIVPDVGEENAAAMTAHALGKGWKVAMLDWIGAEKGDDVIDWVKRGGTLEEFSNLILNKSIEMTNGILPCWSGRFNVEWKR